MIYIKPPLSFEKQADLLLSRGMQGDREIMIYRLQSVNYYRLSGYWYPYRNPDDSFKSGLTFDTVWNRYVFDRHLRILIMDAIERIEIAVRTQIAYHHAHRYGAFCYADDPNSMPQLDTQKYSLFLQRVKDEIDRSRETFVDHFYKKYGDSHTFLPIWMATEVMTFGSVLSFFRGMDCTIQKDISKFFGVPDAVFDSWLLTLNVIRNICAHHGRLWNRELGIKPKLPYLNKNPLWNFSKPVPNNRIFIVLTICQYCLNRIAPQSHWSNRMFSLLKDFPNIPLVSMGFPKNWEQCPIWRNMKEMDYLAGI
ncbi:MAG: Abi family protein [Candidatus Omnitrophota bacterium]